MSRDAPAASPRPEVLAFLADIKDAPEDDTPRLIFADWLEEQGDPRGELMRVQCQLAGMTQDDPRFVELRRREGSLREENMGDWIGRLPPGCKPTFRRGLLHLLLPSKSKTLMGAQMRNWARTEAALWLEAVRFDYIIGLTTAQLASVLEMLPAVCLDLHFINYVGDAKTVELAQLPVLARVRELKLADRPLWTEAAHALATSPHLRQLRVLDLRGNGTISEKMVAVLRARFGEGLRCD
jgi:uncharacterized protein (TIGR02996 family)